MKIKRLTIMLPYLNNVFEVGKPVGIHSSTGANHDYADYGKVKEIKDMSEYPNEGTIYIGYKIIFETGQQIVFDYAPVQVDLEEEVAK